MRHRLHAATCAALSLLALTSCRVGPDFAPPASPREAAYQSPGERAELPAPQVVVPDRVAEADWWRAFGSPVLDRIVADAIAGSLDLDRARARVAEARAVVRVYAGVLDPQVDFDANATRGKLSATQFGLHPDTFELPPNYNVFRLGPDLTWDLDLFGGTRRHVEQETALAVLKQDQLDGAYQTLVSDAVTDTIALARATSELAAVDQILSIDRQDLDLVRRERDAGAVPDSDVILAEAQLAADTPLEPPLRQEASVARHALAALGGNAAGTWSAPSLDLGALVLPHDMPLTLPSELLHRRPDILAAEAQLHADCAAIGVATAQLYPDVTISAGVSAAALDPGHLFTPSALVWSIAAGLTQPVFDGGTRRARRDAAVDAFRASADVYRQTVLDAFREVADRLEALVHDGETVDDERRALAIASESVKLQQLNYAAGGTGILNLLEAQRDYQQAQLGAVRAEGRRFTDTALLLASMGGGWWGAPASVSALAEQGKPSSGR